MGDNRLGFPNSYKPFIKTLTLFRQSTSPPELTSGAGLDTRCPLTGGIVVEFRTYDEACSHNFLFTICWITMMRILHNAKFT